ncbi:nuclear transport factor 2 family protein [Novosphingobium sp. JCM 18896]|uniref:nuclear transport factor 2 family protein n=1 Tax=Novosphingobium sp. JCM 18896 TaxID=2989731 RepID=UPI002221D948|nr:nuclear transport factor 2 family protein [Novosphingobium sp. JCM 18896]MCW1430740.1 nuclear transport factor 2 family protein [Novosphingobium sp. JCM 18896]
MNTADIVELNQLAFRYAAAVDACDVAGIQRVFHPEGRLRSYQPDAEEPFADLRGSDQLAAVPNAMRGMYRATMHMMTNHLVEVDGDTASGEVLCVARHLTRDDVDPVSINVHIRYVDRYVRHEGRWLILDRQIRFLWSERHATADSGMGRGA